MSKNKLTLPTIFAILGFLLGGFFFDNDTYKWVGAVIGFILPVITNLDDYIPEMDE